MLKILINAYACCPDKGSEPGMAWNWIVNLAKYCELFVITESEFKIEIEKTLKNLALGNNIHFHFLPICEDNETKSVEIRKRCWNQGDWRFYIDYAKWQERALGIARKICRYVDIDVIHQLNMIGFREPGRLYKLSKETGIPLVWGPTNAKEGVSLEYLKDTTIKNKLFIILKNSITRLQLKHSVHVRKTAEQSSIIIAASTDSANGIRKYLGTDCIVLNESGSEISPCRDFLKKKNKDTFDLLWVGRFIFTKQLHIALKVVEKLNYENVRLHIVGGTESEEEPFKAFAEKLGISNKIVWHQKIPHSNVQRLMQMSDLFFFTSISEGTPHVVLESFNNKLPVLCFDTCGQGDCVNEKVGTKIQLSNPEKSVEDFAIQIDFLINNQSILKQMSDNCLQRAEELSWTNKAKKMIGLYKQAVEKV